MSSFLLKLAHGFKRPSGIGTPSLSQPACPLYFPKHGGLALTEKWSGLSIKIKLWPFWLALSLAFMGCQKSEFVPDAKFVDLYVELKLATVGYANDMDKVSEVRRVILAQYHETPSGFHNQYVRLMAHPESWRKFQEDVIKQVETFQSSHKIGQVENSNKVDTVGKVEKKK